MTLNLCKSLNGDQKFEKHLVGNTDIQHTFVGQEIIATKEMHLQLRLYDKDF